MGEGLHVLIDGDHVGEHIDLFILQHNMPGLAAFTREIDAGVQRIGALIREAGGEVHMAGGDNVLGFLADLERFLDRFEAMREQLPCSFSVGIGPDPDHALTAINFAKSLAPGSIILARRNNGNLRFSRRNGARVWEDVS